MVSEIIVQMKARDILGGKGREENGMGLERGGRRMG